MFELDLEKVKAYDWSEYDQVGRPMQNLVCRNGHKFAAHNRFDASYPAIISRNPCPVCGIYDILSSHGIVRTSMKIDLKYILANYSYSEAFVAYVLQQIPDMVKEAVARLRYQPFDFDGIYISVGKQASPETELLKLLCDEAFPEPTIRVQLSDANDPLQPLSQAHLTLKTQINGMRASAYSEGATMWVRGIKHPIAQMPLYLEDGAYRQQYIYPLFDWSEAQVLVAVMMLQGKS